MSNTFMAHRKTEKLNPPPPLGLKGASAVGVYAWAVAEAGDVRGHAWPEIVREIWLRKGKGAA